MLCHCVASKKIHTHVRSLEMPCREGGGLKAKFLEAMCKNKLEFPGRRGCKTKNLPLGEYGYFVGLHIMD